MEGLFDIVTRPNKGEATLTLLGSSLAIDASTHVIVDPPPLDPRGWTSPNCNVKAELS
jgi:hypothetical protein